VEAFVSSTVNVPGLALRPAAEPFALRGQANPPKPPEAGAAVPRSWLTGRARRCLDVATFTAAAILFPLAAGLAVVFTALALW
jgi:hypothetical protein